MAHVMNPNMGRVPGPYANNAYIPTTTHGWMHANTWFASAPFNSAPPPAPAGINPQTWANGRWQANPYFRPPPGVNQPNNSFQMWAPHPGWGNTAAGSQSWNPYKRIPNPGDASYWATELSDNPLMLENMHIRDDTPAEQRHRKDSSNGVPHTPWVWVPKELDGETGKSTESIGASESRKGHSEQSQQTQKDLPPAPQTPHRDHTYDHSRTNSSSGNAYTSPPPTYEASNLSRHYQHDASRSSSTTNDRSVPSSAPSAFSTYSAYHQQQQQRQQQHQHQQDSQRASDRYPSSQQRSDTSHPHRRQQSRDVSPHPFNDSQAYSSREYRGGPTPAASSSASAAAAAAARQSSSSSTSSSSNDREGESDEAFSSRRELLPTFSPNIVRTPDYYSRRLGGNRDEAERTPTRHSASTPTHGHIYAPPASQAPTRSNSLNAGRQSSQTPGPGSTVPPNSSLGLMSFTEEPDSVLSPLIVPGTPTRTPPASTRPSPRNDISRSQTYPSAAFDYSPDDRDYRTYRKTPREYPRAISRERSDRREYERSRDVDTTPQPGARTPPAHTPPLSHYTRPSPDSRSSATPISRSHTYPAVIPPPITPQRSRSPRRSPSQGQSQSFSAAYQHSSSSPYTRTPPNPPASSMANASSPLRHNPLPRPPQASPYAEQLTRGAVSSSASAAAAMVAAQQNAQRRQVRLGYWNRRGDHLYVTEQGHRYVVYAPRHLANPEDLKHYPSPTEGWKDHNGSFIKYDPVVPELLDSLPLHGEEPSRPYQHFVQYVTVTI
ncbi:hypothetical protein C8Q79DRAFT_1010069 [Trametes meyenii]|nr:hypothetical protein C8Q79DRAFT_1010069 [Trametes meyenii]